MSLYLIFDGIRYFNVSPLCTEILLKSCCDFLEASFALVPYLNNTLNAK